MTDKTKTEKMIERALWVQSLFPRPRYILPLISKSQMYIFQTYIKNNEKER